MDSQAEVISEMFGSDTIARDDVSVTLVSMISVIQQYNEADSRIGNLCWDVDADLSSLDDMFPTGSGPLD